MPRDERAQVGLVVGLDGGYPGVECVALQCGEHGREPADVRAQGVQVRAGRPDVTV
jgi:hypothetical protein